MSANTPPDPIWEDDATGMSVRVNGGLVEFRAKSAYHVLTPNGVSDLAPALFAALIEAASWTELWDIVTGCYAEADA